MTTSSSDKEKLIKRIRKDKNNQFEETIEIGNDIDQIRKEINNNKENEGRRDNVFTEHVSPAIFNSSSQLNPLNPALQVDRLPNVTYEQYFGNNSVHEKTYTELLTQNSSSSFNKHTMGNASFPRSTANSYMSESHTNSISNEKSVPTSFYERSSLTQRYEAPHYQV